MKCEKCNKNEANYYYRETINGKTTEKHLCADCAKEEGLTSAFDWDRQDFFGDFFGDFFSPRRSLVDEFFGGSMLPTLTRTMFSPMRLFPHVEIGRMEPEAEQSEAQSEAEAGIPKDVGTELRQRRELLSLKHQLRQAVRAEDFEKAIELRDKIREIEGKAPEGD